LVNEALVDRLANIEEAQNALTLNNMALYAGNSAEHDAGVWKERESIVNRMELLENRPVYLAP
jgi:hypothetical protein